MYNFEIRKDKLDKSYTGINTVSLGLASGQLKLCGLKLFLYLAGNRDGFSWTLNPTAYAGWLGVPYEGSSARAVRKAINDGIADLIENNYLEKIDENTLKILKSLFTTDVLTIIKEVTPLVLQGKQLNALIGASSLGKGPRQACQALQIPFRMAMKEAQKMGYLTKMRYEKLQKHYMEFVNALIDDVFGNPSMPEIEGEDELNEE